jgi:hypothetical protein
MPNPPPPGFITPKYTTLANFGGGINLSQPKDQIGDTQSSDMQNLVYINGVLQVDTGYRSYGTRVAGIPLQTIAFELTSGVLTLCLVTSVAFYTYNSGIKDWQIAMTPVVTKVITGTNYNTTPWGSSFSSNFGPFTNLPVAITVGSTSGVAVGNVVSIPLVGGNYFTSTVTSIVGSVITCANALAAGQIIANGVTASFYTTFNGGAYPISWTVDPTVNSLIWTNGVDPVQCYQGGLLAPLAGLASIASTARIVIRFFGFTLAIGTTEGGTVYPYRVRRSSNVSSTDWTSYAITGYDNLTDTPDEIVAATVIGTTLILAREQSIMSGVYWGTTDAVFFWQYTVNGTGALGGNGLIKTRDIDYLITQSGVFQYSGGYSVTSVGDAVFDYFLGPEGNLNPEASQSLFAIYVAELDEVWVFYPSTGKTYCDTILRYSQKYKAWFPITLPLQITGAGFAYTTSALSWAESVGASWLDDTVAWNARASQGNYPILLLCSATDSQVYAYDFQTGNWNGAEIPWYFVSKDFPILEEKLIFDGIAAYGMGNGVLCEISTDSGTSYQTVGTFNFGTQNFTKQVLDYQITGDFFRFRLSGVGYGFFLSQLSFRFLEASEY